MFRHDDDEDDDLLTDLDWPPQQQPNGVPWNRTTVDSGQMASSESAWFGTDIAGDPIVFDGYVYDDEGEGGEGGEGREEGGEEEEEGGGMVEDIADEDVEYDERAIPDVSGRFDERHRENAEDQLFESPGYGDRGEEEEEEYDGGELDEVEEEEEMEEVEEEEEDDEDEEDEDAAQLSDHDDIAWGGYENTQVPPLYPGRYPNGPFDDDAQVSLLKFLILSDNAEGVIDALGGPTNDDGDDQDDAWEEVSRQALEPIFNATMPNTIARILAAKDESMSNDTDSSDEGSEGDDSDGIYHGNDYDDDGFGASGELSPHVPGRTDCKDFHYWTPPPVVVGIQPSHAGSAYIIEAPSALMLAARVAATNVVSALLQRINPMNLPPLERVLDYMMPNAYVGKIVARLFISSAQPLQQMGRQVAFSLEDGSVVEETPFPHRHVDRREDVLTDEQEDVGVHEGGQQLYQRLYETVRHCNMADTVRVVARAYQSVPYAAVQMPLPIGPKQIEMDASNQLFFLRRWETPPLLIMSDLCVKRSPSGQVAPFPEARSEEIDDALEEVREMYSP